MFERGRCSVDLVADGMSKLGGREKERESLKGGASELSFFSPPTSTISMSLEITFLNIATNFGLADGSYLRLIAHDRMIFQASLSVPEQLEALGPSVLASVCQFNEMGNIVSTPSTQLPVV